MEDINQDNTSDSSESISFSIFSDSSTSRKYPSSSTKSSAIRIKIKEIEQILISLNENKQQFFKNMSDELRTTCDKLIKLLSIVDDANSKDTIVSLYDRIFDDTQIMIPGTIGSYISNCIHNFRNKQLTDSVDDINAKSIEEISKYDDCNFLFYDYDNKLFTPLRLEKDNKKTIIIVNNDNNKPFSLGIHERNMLKNMNIDVASPIQVMSYSSRTKTLKEIYNNENTKTEIQVRRNNLLVGGIIFMFIAAIVILFCVMINSEEKKYRNNKGARRIKSGKLISNGDGKKSFIDEINEV